MENIKQASAQNAAGMKEVPHKPTIRFATPLFDSQGSRRGILVINLDGGAMLARFTADVGNLYLVNQDGYFLKHPDSGKQFGFDLGHDHRLKDIHPRLADQLKKVDEIAEYWSGEGESEMRPHVHGFKKLYYDPRHQEALWALVFDVPEAAAFGVLDTLRWTFAWLGLLIAVLGGVAALMFSQRFSRPLATLAAAAERVAAGDLTVDTPADDRADELGTLMYTFRRMVENLRVVTREIREGIDVLAAAVEILAPRRRWRRARRRRPRR